MKKMLTTVLLFGMAFASGSATQTGATRTGATRTGATQLEGCLNQTLFDGVWQVKAQALKRIPKVGWGLTLEVRNGSQATIMPIEAGISGVGTGIRLVSGGGRSLSVDSFDVASMTAKTLSPGARVVGQLKFHDRYGKVLDISRSKTGRCPHPSERRGLWRTQSRFSNQARLPEVICP
jgi:hypothetical protein